MEDNFNNGEKLQSQYTEFCTKYGNGKDGKEGRDRGLVRICCNVKEPGEVRGLSHASRMTARIVIGLMTGSLNY